jgi:hypothetical protein
MMVEAGIKTGLDRAGIAKFDLLGFDACLMASVELVVQFAPYCRHFMASEELEPGTGWDWTSLSSLNKDPSMSALAFATAMADGFMSDPKKKGASATQLTMSITDMSAVTSFSDAVERLAQALVNAMADLSIMTALSAAKDTAYRMGDDFVDFGHLLQLLSSDMRLDGRIELKELINTTLRAYSSAMVFNKHSDDLLGPSGLSCARALRPLYWCRLCVLQMSLDIMSGSHPARMSSRRSEGTFSPCLCSPSGNWPFALYSTARSLAASRSRDLARRHLQAQIHSQCPHLASPRRRTSRSAVLALRT